MKIKDLIPLIHWSTKVTLTCASTSEEITTYPSIEDIPYKFLENTVTGVVAIDKGHIGLRINSN